MEGTMVSQDFRRQLEGYGLTTANILYRRPDHPWLLQSYVWQDYDLCPVFPALNKFLNFWLETLEGPLHSVTVAHARLIKPAEIRAIDGEFRLHCGQGSDCQMCARHSVPRAQGRRVAKRRVQRVAPVTARRRPPDLMCSMVNNTGTDNALTLSAESVADR